MTQCLDVGKWFAVEAGRSRAIELQCGRWVNSKRTIDVAWPRAEIGKCELPLPVYPEPVEGLLFLQAVARDTLRKGQCFDKLSIGGFGVR